MNTFMHRNSFAFTTSSVSVLLDPSGCEYTAGGGAVAVAQVHPVSPLCHHQQGYGPGAAGWAKFPLVVNPDIEY